MPITSSAGQSDSIAERAVITAGTSGISTVCESRRDPAQIQEIFEHLDKLLGTTLPGAREPGHRPNDVSARLMRSANTLYDKGLTTAASVDKWLSSCWRHDHVDAVVGQGLARNLGYMLSMSAVNESINANAASGALTEDVQKLLANPALFGLVVGLSVGAMDVIVGQVMSASAKARLYNPRCDDSLLPASIEATDSERVFRNDTLVSTAVNVLKNSLRVAAPVLQMAIEQRPDKTIDSRIHSSLDTVVMDAGLGVISSGIDSALQLSRPNGYTARLIMRSDIGNVFEKSTQSWAVAQKDAAGAALRGASSLVTSMTPAAVVMTIAAFVSTLISTNSRIGEVGAAAYEKTYGAPLPDGRLHYTTAMQQRSSSVFNMGILTLAVPMIARGVDEIVDKLAAALVNMWENRNKSPSKKQSPKTDAADVEAPASDMGEEVNEDRSSVHVVVEDKETSTSL